ncbi:type VI secretion system contractile sheath domain-containing protein [Methylomonas koyamae]|uniref:type VI secretion system contractile sheath domain-containing protein n=1 Tax=Methylomonas koyamae TaxID=702114 RepID=UPI0012F6EB6C|nr:type VI secretion system contractile sheath large subunit [Methylomonas koyamae]
MLERLLGKRPEATSPATDSVERLIRDMVAPHVAKSVSAEHQALAAVVDATISQFIATLLHSPDFRGLEALWLALRDLLNEEGADTQQWFLLDLSQQELAQAAQNEPDTLKQKLAAHLQTADAAGKCCCWAITPSTPTAKTAPPCAIAAHWPPLATPVL